MKGFEVTSELALRSDISQSDPSVGSVRSKLYFISVKNVKPKVKWVYVSLTNCFSVSKYDFSDIIRDHPRCSSQLDRHITGLSLSKKKVIIFPKLKKKKNKRASKLQNQYTINLVSSERSKK